MLRNVWNWIDERSGLGAAARHFLDEEIPASSGWHQVFGSVSLFLFLLQICTGVLLAINYAPTPTEAYDSVRYIVTAVAGGSMIRGLHHWGASLMIVLVVIHMAQVFVYGAYKKPRELTWLLGIVLLLLTLAFGLTGYLLPWDNRAYWGTMITTQIAGTAPLVGKLTQQLMGAADSVGSVTFSRFYIAHVLLLPLITLLLVGAHVFLVRKHGAAPQPGDEHRPRKRFFPGQVLKDTVAIFAVFIGLYLLASFANVGLEEMADPTDNSYVPRPDWYFLFLFEILKHFHGPLEVVGTVGIPTLAIGALVLAPFVDRGKVVPVAKRGAAFAVAVLGAIVWGGLTVRAVKTTPPPPTDLVVDYSKPQPWLYLKPSEIASVGYYRQAECGKCHENDGVLNSPTLKDQDWLLEHFRTKANVGGMQTFQEAALAQTIRKLDRNFVDSIKHAPDLAVRGAEIVHSRRCSTCHIINGEGYLVGPSLNGISRRRTAIWVRLRLKDPKAVNPETIMPPTKLDPAEERQLVAYLFSLRP